MANSAEHEDIGGPRGRLRSRNRAPRTRDVERDEDDPVAAARTCAPRGPLRSDLGEPGVHGSGDSDSILWRRTCSWPPTGDRARERARGGAPRTPARAATRTRTEGEREGHHTCGISDRRGTESPVGRNLSTRRWRAAVVVVDKAAFGAQELAANFPWSDPIADRMVFLSDLPAALPLTFKKPLDATDLEKVVRRPHGRLWVAPPSDDRLRCSPTIALCVHTLAGRVRRRACCLVETEEPASKPPPRSELVLDRRGDLFDHLAEIASSGLQVTRAQRLGGARSGGSTLVRLGALRRNGRRGRRRGPSRLRRARAPLVERGHQAST